MRISGEIDKYDCDKCRKYKHYIEKGCDGGIFPSVSGESDEPFQVGDKYISFCPKILSYDEDLLFNLELFKFYEDGHLFFNDGIINQPFWYIETMREMSMEKNRWQQQKQQQS